jgi:transmembrane sensor
MKKLRDVIDRHRAAKDLAKLFSNDLQGPDVEGINQRREQSENYEREFTATAHRLDDVDALADDPDILAALDDIDGELSRDGQRSGWAPMERGFAVAAVLLVAIGVSFTGWFSEPTPEPANALLYRTQIGEQKTISLSDGSTLTLNTGTKVLVKYSEKKRHLILHRGEAYFSVAKDPDRPFTVELGSRAVSALGTEFNIQKSPDRFTLAVIEGVVSIHNKEELASSSAPLISVDANKPISSKLQAQRRVIAGVVAEFDVESEHVLVYEPEDINRQSSWRQGAIRFDEEPLYRVVQELNRYTAKKILIEDSSIMELNVYAVVRLDQISQALVGLENLLPVKVVEYFDKIVITRK